MKRYYIAACILLFLAIASDIIGKHYYSNGMCILAKAVSQGSTAYEAAKHESEAVGMTGNYFNAAGLLLALGGVVAWVRSMLMGNRERRHLTSVHPFTLTVAYILVYLVCV